MPEARVVPDRITYSAAISACSKGGQWQLALNLLSLMPEARVVPDRINYNAAISACEKGSQWQLASNLLSLRCWCTAITS
jgi:pentatricopeptide repeat domain-containing protein 1